jgi:hypothetical protein
MKRKYHKVFSLDLDLIKRIEKEGNASQLVGDLLKKHYEEIDSPYDNMEEDEIIKEIMIEELKETMQKELEEKIKEIRINGE